MAEAHKHPYHLVDPSPWPFVGGVAALAMFGGAVLWIHGFAGPYISLAGFLGLLFTMFVWWRDVIREAEHDGFHNKVVQLGLRYGMTLFIASEVMFFAAFFWAFFDSALFGEGGVQVGEAAKMYAREAANGGQWPPAHIHVFDAWDLPLINTMILLLSGCTVTWAHHALKMGDRKGLVQGLTATVLLGMSFTGLQAIEYAQAPFSFAMLIEGGQKVTEEGAHIADGGIYSSAFFMATGLSRLPRHRRHDLPGGLPVPRGQGALQAGPPFRLRGGGLVLAFRRCRLAVPVLLHLCRRECRRAGRNPLAGGTGSSGKPGADERLSLRRRPPLQMSGLR